MSTKIGRKGLGGAAGKFMHHSAAATIMKRMKPTRKTPAPAKCLLALTAGILLLAGSVHAQGYNQPPGRHSWPPARHYHLEHPRERMAYWYANESMLQAQQARDMMCGFTGQHWALDWDVHHRWAKSAGSKRAYKRVAEREKHLSGCRRRKLHDRQLP